MPYQPTNPYPYNTAIDFLKDGLQFRFKVDNYDTIESFKIELYDYLRNKKLYTIVRTIGDIQIETIDNQEIKTIIQGDKQLIQILNENEEQILLKEYTEDFETPVTELPIKGGLGVNSVGEVDITPYLMTIEAIEMKQYYGNTENYEMLRITNEECFILDEKGTIISYIENNNTVDINNIVIPYRTSKGIVKNIGSGVFANNLNIYSVVVPSCVTTIEDNAFNHCENLTIVNFNYGISYLNERCFANCTDLFQINLLDSINIIGDSAFENCTNLINLRLPWSLKEINSRTFSNIGIETLELPPNLETVKSNAFDSCKKLETVICNEKLKIIQAQAFGECTSLTTIALNEDLLELGKEVFVNCSALQEIQIPDNIMNIGEGILNGCNMLITLTVPFIGSKKTEGEEIADIVENKKITSVLGYFFGTTTDEKGIKQRYAPLEEDISFSKTQTYLIPESLSTVVITNTIFIPYGAFSNCVNIRNIKMLDKIIYIDDYSFFNCIKISEVQLSPNIEYIGNYAFALEKPKTLK